VVETKLIVNHARSDLKVTAKQSTELKYFTLMKMERRMATTFDDLANMTDPTKGAALVGYRGRKLSEKLMSEFISVADAGVFGDGGVTDPFQKLKALIESAPDGATIFFPPGRYKTIPRDHTIEANWIQITQSGLRLEATPGSATLENFLIYAGGEAGPRINIGANFGEGAISISTSTAHGLQTGDYVQLLSARNAYTPDGGAWQLGSKSPSNLELPICRYAEIHQVAEIPTATTLILHDSVIYPGYDTTSSGYVSPISGVTSAEIRKIIPIKGLIFSGLKFIKDQDDFRHIIIRKAVDVIFERCEFESHTLAGVHLRTTDVFRLTLRDIVSTRMPQSASGSSWNSFIFAGCTQEILIAGCHFINEQQTIDFTPNYADQNIGSVAQEVDSNYLTTQRMQVHNSSFDYCTDGFTSHPGTYDLLVTGNNFRSQCGIRIRSKSPRIYSNNFKCISASLVFSGFYEGADIRSNAFEDVSIDNQAWQAIQFTALSSEIMNNNNIQCVVISGNSFRRYNSNPYSNSSAIFFRNYANGIPRNDAFDLYTDAIKTSLSRYQISDNDFFACSINIHRYFNGVEVRRNSFSGGSPITHYIYCEDNSARHLIDENFFSDSLCGAVRTGIADAPTFPYSTAHYIGEMKTKIGVILSSVLMNTSSIQSVNNSGVMHDHLQVANNGQLFSARVGPGTATLNLDAHPNDGTSPALVNVFENSVTAGKKIMRVYGSIRFLPPNNESPQLNGEVSFELTDNSTLSVKARGSDGIVRTARLTLVQ